MAKEKFERNKPHVNIGTISGAMDGDEVEDTNYDKYITGMGYNNHDNPSGGKYGSYQCSNVEILLMIICILLVLLVLINLSRFCYQIYQNKNKNRIEYKSVEKNDIENESKYLKEINIDDEDV